MLMAIVILSVAPVPVVMTFPPASSTATLGWVPKAVPPVDAVGFCVKASWAGAPRLTLKVALVAVSVPVVSTSVAVSVYVVPIVLTEHPLKVAMPPVTVCGSVVHVRAPGPPPS